MNNNYTTFINVSLSLPSLSHTRAHTEQYMKILLQTVFNKVLAYNII